MTRRCPVCGEVSDVDYRCTSCGADLVDRDRSRDRDRDRELRADGGYERANGWRSLGNPVSDLHEWECPDCGRRVSEIERAGPPDPCGCGDLVTDGGRDAHATSEADRAVSGWVEDRAVSGWVEVRDDGIPVLCLDTDRGTTEAFELSPEAAGNLRREFIDGPTVRHDRTATKQRGSRDV